MQARAVQSAMKEWMSKWKMKRYDIRGIKNFTRN